MGRLEQRTLHVPRRQRERIQGGVSDPPGRLVHHPAEGFVILEIDREFQVGHHVLHLRALEEGIARIDHIRDVPPTEGFLQGAGLGIRPVEDGEILVLGLFFLHPADDAGGHEGGLLPFGIGAQDPDLLPFLPHGHTLLGNPVFVPGNQGVGRIDNHLGRAVIPFQAEDFRRREIPPEVQDIGNLRPAEAIDGL